LSAFDASSLPRPKTVANRAAASISASFAAQYISTFNSNELTTRIHLSGLPPKTKSPAKADACENSS
jgi:uncharacterized protein YydD (DUF2326 family)